MEPLVTTETFKSISHDKVDSATEVCMNQLWTSIVSLMQSEHKFTNDADDDDNDMSPEERREKSNLNIWERRDECIMLMEPLFASQPKLELICKDWRNNLVDTNFTNYFFSPLASKSLGEINEFENVLNLCGRNLTYLNISDPCPSSIMPLIKLNCLNLEFLGLKFHHVKSDDFKDCFINMPHLERLLIRLKCKNSTIPMTLVKSLEPVCETLKKLSIEPLSEENPLFSPGVISPSTETLISYILNMKNIEQLTIHFDHGITDEFLITLIKNAKKLETLHIIGSNITDTGIKALNDAKQLKNFNLDLFVFDLVNAFITDESIQSLTTEKLEKLQISCCVNVTNSAVFSLIKNLPCLKFLYVENTKVTNETSEEIDELERSGKIDCIVFSC